jgi:hypothetical protein
VQAAVRAVVAGEPLPAAAGGLADTPELPGGDIVDPCQPARPAVG